MNRIEKARAFAVKHHGDQKYSVHPYVYHLDAVAEIVREVDPQNTEAIVTAYLHDVLEDTEATFNEIAHEFGIRVAEDVQHVSDKPGITRHAKKRATNMRLRDLPGMSAMIPCLVKLADRLANVRSCVEENNKLLGMYRKEHEAFRLAVYRSVEAWQPLMDELDSLLDAQPG